MKDLMAVATVRRLLIELGYTLSPEDPRGEIGPLALWIAQPRVDLAGQTPQEVLQGPDGEAKVSEVLRRMLEHHMRSPDAPG